MNRALIPTAAASFALGCVVGWFSAVGAWFFQAHQLMDSVTAASDKLQVHCFAKKYSWQFHYTGPDGKLGKTRHPLISATNPVGLDLSDPHSKDDFVANELVLPTGTWIELITGSADVIHALGEFNSDMKVDATPGVTERLVFRTPAHPVSGTLRCVQLCGPGFKDHHASYRYVTTSDFTHWQSAQPPKPIGPK